MKDFNLKRLVIFISIACLFLAVAGVGGFDWDTSEFEVFMNDGLELQNWHYYLLIVIVYFKGD